MAPYSYSLELQNGDIFYMTTENESGDLPESGLYSVGIDGGYELVYHINEYFYKYDVTMSSDGKYFAVTPWVNYSEDTVITFYKNGEAQKTYGSSELMRDIKNREYTSSHYFWEESDSRTFDSETNQLSVTTLDGMKYTFDLATGAIIDTADTRKPIMTGIIITAACILISALVFMFYKVKTQNKAK